MIGGGESPAPSTRKAYWRVVPDREGSVLVNELGQIIVFGDPATISEYGPEAGSTVQRIDDRVTASQELTESILYDSVAWTTWGREIVNGQYNMGNSFEFTLPTSGASNEQTYQMELNEEPIIPLTPNVSDYIE